MPDRAGALTDPWCRAGLLLCAVVVKPTPEGGLIRFRSCRTEEWVEVSVRKHDLGWVTSGSDLVLDVELRASDLLALNLLGHVASVPLDG